MRRCVQTAPALASVLALTPEDGFSKLLRQSAALWDDRDMADGWSKDAVDQTIVAYFDMLGNQLAGTSFVKAAVEQKLSTAISRSTSAVGYKFSNISAVLSEEGLVFLAGYGPQHNYQALLRDRVLAWLIDEPAFRDQVMVAVNAAPVGALGELGAPKSPPTISGGGRHGGRRSGRFPDYQEIEQRNRELGKAGEELVVAREQKALAQAGRHDLAAKVWHVSVVEGDGLGYDVLSFYPDGSPRYLEVKTTRNSASQPFFVSRNEVAVSGERDNAFTLVRIYQFGHAGMACYELTGDLRTSALLSPEVYSARPAAP